MKITFDPRKRDNAYEERGLRFEDAEVMFAGLVHTFEDTRRDYGERRLLSIGFLAKRMIVVGWTPRNGARHVFTMRKAMTASRRSTARSSAGKPVMSDLAHIDAHTIAAHEYDEAPDLSGRDPSEGVLEIAGTPVRRGRPSKPDRKLSTTLRLDPDILDHFKSGGPGWQGRINAALRKSMQG